MNALTNVFLLADVSQYIFGPLIFVLSLFMILLILVQRGRGGGLAGALGGPGGQSAFGTKAGDLFTRITIVTAAIWIFLLGFSTWFYTERKFSDAFDADAGAISTVTNSSIGSSKTVPDASNTNPSTSAPAAEVIPQAEVVDEKQLQDAAAKSEATKEPAAQSPADVTPKSEPTKETTPSTSPTSDAPAADAPKTEPPKSESPTPTEPSSASENAVDADRNKGAESVETKDAGSKSEPAAEPAQDSSKPTSKE